MPLMPFAARSDGQNSRSVQAWSEEPFLQRSHPGRILAAVGYACVDVPVDNVDFMLGRPASHACL